MCTLIVLWRAHPAAPLVVALNRDELLARRTAPVARWPDDDIVAGRDLESGGTWFGVGKHTVAGLTNHRSGLASPRRGRSRGKLVVTALRARSVEEVRERLAPLPMSEYGGFHLLVADGEALSVFTNKSGVLEERAAAPGVHVLGNYGLDDATDPVVATLEPEVTRFLDDEGAADEEALAAFLRDALGRHGPGWPCVHYGIYGTVSSALLFARDDESRLEVSEGPGCQAAWRDESALLRR